MARYVLLAEIVGYGVAAGLLAAWIGFFFIEIDEHCYANGTVGPAHLEISIPQRAVLEELITPYDEWVEEGQSLLRLNLNAKAVAATQARDDMISLGEQIVTLAEDPSRRAEIETQLDKMVDSVGSLAEGRNERIIKSPGYGLLGGLRRRRRSGRSLRPMG